MTTPDLTRGRHQTVKKSHKAVIGALLVAEKPLCPVQYGRRTFWTLDFLMPSGPVWDILHPLILTENKVKGLLDAGFVVADQNGELHLTRGGAMIAEGCESDWATYWDLHYARRWPGLRMDWRSYFKTGQMRI